MVVMIMVVTVVMIVIVMMFMIVVVTVVMIVVVMVVMIVVVMVIMIVIMMVLVVAFLFLSVHKNADMFSFYSTFFIVFKYDMHIGNPQAVHLLYKSFLLFLR